MVSRGWPAGRCGTSRAPVLADTMGGTTGISHPPKAALGRVTCRVNAQYGTTTALASPVTVPAVHKTASRARAARSPMRSCPTNRGTDPMDPSRESMGRLGCRCAVRPGSSAGRTFAGALLADWARGVLAAAEVLDAGIASLRTVATTRLRVAASHTIAELLLPGWLATLAAQSPDTAVSLAAVNSSEAARQVLAAEADIEVVEGPDPRLVQREPTSGTRAALDRALARYLPAAPAVLELSTASAVRSAAAAGAGPAVLSSLAVADDLAAGRLREVPVDGADLHRSLRAVWPRGQRPTGPARDLLAIAGRLVMSLAPTRPAVDPAGP